MSSKESEDREPRNEEQSLKERGCEDGKLGSESPEPRTEPRHPQGEEVKASTQEIFNNQQLVPRPKVLVEEILNVQGKTKDKKQKTNYQLPTTNYQVGALAEIPDLKDVGKQNRSLGGDPGSKGHRDTTPAFAGRLREHKRQSITPAFAGSLREHKRQSIKKKSLFVIYFKKLLFPRTFSFIAMPKIIVFPALFMSIVMFRRFWKGGRAELLALPILLWSYMVIYIIRESHGRYLMPMLPLLALFFAFFMIEGLKKKWFPGIVLLICGILVALGFTFEIKFVAVKIGFNVILFSFVILALISYRKKWRYANLFALAVPLFSGLFSIGTALASSLTQSDGQMRSFFRYGYIMEVKKVVSEFKPDEKFWLNGFASGYMMYFYMGERLTAGERTWRLAEWVPKKQLLRRYDDNQHRRIGTRIRSMKRFRKAIMTNSVTKVGLVISTYPKQKFSYQNRLDDFRKADWLELERTVQFKNKKLFIFNINR